MLNSERRLDGINLSALAAGLKPLRALPSQPSHAYYPGDRHPQANDSNSASFDTSSGCSSAGSSSLIDSPGSSSSKYRGDERSAGGVTEPARKVSRDTDDYLEVNELLYLPRLRHKPKRTETRRPADQPDEGAAMSQFSAFSLHKRLVGGDPPSQLVGSTDEGPVHVRSLKRSATLKGTGKKQACSCCCCLRICSPNKIQPRAAQSSLNQPRQEINSRLNNKSATLARTSSSSGNQPANLRRQSLVPPRTCSTLSSRVQRRHRRPLPVPPPVVPLFRELQLDLGASQATTVQSCQQPERAGSLDDVAKLNMATIRGSYSFNWRSLHNSDGLSKSCTQIGESEKENERVSSFLSKLRRSLFRLNNYQNQKVVKSSDDELGESLTTSKCEADQIGDDRKCDQIYDTPEFNAQTGHHLRRPAIRPSIPPPPPPPPPAPRLRDGTADCAAPTGEESTSANRGTDQARTRPENLVSPCKRASSSVRLISHKENHAKQVQEASGVEEKKRKVVKWAQDARLVAGFSAHRQQEFAIERAWLGRAGAPTELVDVAAEQQGQKKKGILVSKQQGNDMGAGQSAVAQPHQRQIHTSNKLVNSDLNRIDQSNPGVKTNKSKLNSDEPALSKNQQINEDSQTLLIISKGHTNGRQVTFKSPPTSYTYQRRHAHIRRLPASGAKEPHHVVGVDTAEQHPASPVPATAGKGGDVIERKRRESMQNGDVFIYPSNYRHMNECNKCSRDNKICNCNLAVASEDSTSSDKDSSLQIAAQETARPAIDSGTEDQVTSSTLETDHTLLDGCSRGGLGSTKTYKISIARALLDQKNNQIHLTKPQIIAAIPYSGELGTNTPGAEQQLDKLESVSEALDEPRRTPILTSPTSSPGDLSAISSETPYGFKRLHTAPCETSSGSSLHLSSFELEAGSAAIQSGLKSPVQIAKADSLVLLASPSGPTSGSCRSLGGPEEASSEPSSCPGSSETIKSLTSFCQLDRQASIRRQTSKVTTVSIGANRAPDFQQVSSADHDETMLSKAPVYGEQYDKPICTGARQFIGPQAGLWNQPCQAKLSEEERLSSWPNEASSTLCSNMADEDQELLCNLTIGGSIKITSTSIHVGSTDSACKQLPLDLVTTTAASSSMTASTTTFETTSAITKVNHASIIPIQTLSARRRNMSTSKLCRLAIHEDDGDSFNLPEVDLLQDKSDNKGSVSLLSCPKDHTSTTIVDGISTSADLESLVGTARVGSTMVSIEPGLVRVPVKQESDGIILNSMDTPETAKKSIFEGASKDEILEYFEDARERVPEILMAADDVMVINENELIVVNQLEPGSPATPISIVEAPELLEETLSIPSVTPVDQIVASQANSDQVRERLQQMYQASKQVSSQYIDNNEDSPELDRRIPKLDLLGRPNVSADDAKSDESLTVEVEKRTSEASKLKRHSGSSLRRPASSSVSNTSNSSEPNSTADLQTSISSPMSLFRGRRNSTSAESSSQIERNCAMQMMMLQKRYSNRDSLSSSSSSPPSSCSPSSAGSSTSSSAQTSGNCSVASNFYASSSLSCSSPLLAQAIRLSPSSSSGSPAFNLSLANSCPPEGEQPSSFTNRLISSLISEDATLADPSQVERDDSGLGYESSGANKSSLADRLPGQSSPDAQLFETSPNSATRDEVIGTPGRYPVPAWDEQKLRQLGYSNGKRVASSLPGSQRLNTAKGFITTNSASFASRLPHGHFATVNRLNNYFLNRRSSGDALDGKNEFQCLDCDQFIDVDHATLMSKSNEFRLLREVDNLPLDLIYNEQSGKRLTPSQLDRAYIAAMNGLPLCKSCEKKRVERKEIISEFVETELKYGRDLKIIHDEFYRPMQIAGLLTKDQISGVFLNLEELIMANCRFADRLQSAIGEAHTMADTDYNTINIGRIFVESAEMLHTFETYCIRQGSAACLLARLAKEKELLRIFLRVSQMENTLLRRMNLAAFLMVPVQRVTKYPLLLSRLYKVTAYHHKDREALRDAQLKVELHLEHINQQTKGIGATNKIWRRISNLSAPISNRRGLINTEDIGYIKLRKTALDMLKWDREETQFIHSGKVSFAPLTEYLTKQKMKPLRYMPAHALLIVLGKPNWKYRPDLVKATLDSKLMTPTSGGTGIKETVLLLFREKNGRFVACREPLFLSNCVFSNDFSQFNCEFPHNQPAHHNAIAKSSSPQVGSKQGNVTTGELNKDKSSQDAALAKSGSRGSDVGNSDHQSVGNGSTNGGDAISMSSMKSLNDEPAIGAHPPTSPVYSSRSYSLASALPASAMSASNNGSSSSLSLAKSTSTPSSSNMTILNQLRTKVNIYHKQSSVQTQKLADQSKTTAISSSFHVDDNNNSTSNSGLNRLLDMHASASRHGSPSTTGNTTTLNGTSTANNNNGLSTLGNTGVEQGQHHFNHHFFHNHHQPYGDYEESLEIHDRLTKESILLKADTPLKTRYWLQMLRYHAKDLGVWRTRRNGLANIMMMINKD